MNIITVGCVGAGYFPPSPRSVCADLQCTEVAALAVRCGAQRPASYTVGEPCTEGGERPHASGARARVCVCVYGLVPVLKTFKGPFVIQWAVNSLLSMWQSSPHSFPPWASSPGFPDHPRSSSSSPSDCQADVAAQ